MLPMGTIVTVVMFLGLLFATRIPLLRTVQRLPLMLRRFVGTVVLLAGAWNVFWHALRHLTEFWGIAALVSGSLMMAVAVLILKENNSPTWLRSARPVILLALLACAVYYGWTIVRL